MITMRFLLIILAYIKISSSSRKSEVLANIDGFCLNSDSNICKDYARLRRVRQVAEKSNATLVSDIESGIDGNNGTMIEDEEDLLVENGNETITNQNEQELEPPGEVFTAEQIREELRKIIQEEYMRKTIQTIKDDPACDKLREEYDEVCFSTPPLAAFQETREFCMAFVKNCQHSLLTNMFTNLKNFKIDFTAYCKKHLERFKYVCPDPLRFNSFAQDAVEFCVRYKERCPKQEVPAEPVQFKRKNEDHIYTREIEFWCTRTRRTAYNYCTELELLKVPKYAQFCGLYKYACIDVYRRVIYG